MSDNDIYKAPESKLLDENNVSDIELAGRWYRLGGAIVDSIAFMAVYIPVMIVLGVWETIIGGEKPTFLLTLTLTAIGLLIFVCLNGYFLYTNGQTIGKKLLGTKIVSASTHEILPLGKVMSFRVLPVQVASIVPFIGPWMSIVDVLFIFGKSKQCVHDLIANTIVIKVQQD
ncbi:RDD family protein [Saccharophagus degradans]|uniref:RDD family protein n=1 Tax=Saccharophagus degradans TaxID=86304 RepID=A0AAW7X4E3_9GAMM|nr:RDD family protein [Saccharophagus degradans]MBU2986688.1 RDD family protein [Saccharophagus degradans]MDO6422685.1 RDD family protein [Saccharophagus degradans]MDO6609620.1 RDD family protein [Saccharophagus degradans]WGO98544.1 RDD family protein [Saccharophagus degradans]